MRNIGRKIILAGVIAVGSLAVMVTMTVAAVSKNVKTVSIDDFKIDESVKVPLSWSEVPKVASKKEKVSIDVTKEAEPVIVEEVSETCSEPKPAPETVAKPVQGSTPKQEQVITPESVRVSKEVLKSVQEPTPEPETKTTPEPVPEAGSAPKLVSIPEKESPAPSEPESLPEKEFPAEPSYHYETVIITPERKVYDVAAFDEPVMGTFNVFYDFDGNVLKMIPADNGGVSMNADGSVSSDPVGEYALYVVTNHLGRGNWYVEKHQVDTIHHEAVEGLSEEEFKDYKRSLGSKEGFVYKERTIPAETKKVWVED